MTQSDLFDAAESRRRKARCMDMGIDIPEPAYAA